MAALIADLARAVPAALAGGVLPGYFWAVFLRRTDGLAERLAYSTALSLATVPVVAVALARVFDTGITLGVAIAAVAIVLASGALACRIWGTARGRLTRVRSEAATGGNAGAGAAEAGSGPLGDGCAEAPALPRPGAITDGKSLALVIVAIGLALVSAAGLRAPAWLLLAILIAVAAAGLLTRTSAAPVLADGQTDPGGGGMPGGSGGPGGPGGSAKSGGPAGSGGQASQDGAPTAFAAGPGAATAATAGAVTAATPAHATAVAATNGAVAAASTGAVTAAAATAISTAAAAATNPDAGNATAATPAAGTATALPSTAAVAPASSAAPLISRALRAPILAVVLALTAVRAYSGVVWHDWPFLRGQDMFSHAVMAEQMMAHGAYGSYLVYPPGFSAVTAVICRFAGLEPLTLYPVIAPALLLLTTIAAYALATRLWGWEFGLIAAALSGLVLTGPDVSFSGGLYPDLTAAFVLMFIVVAALVSLCQSPSLRSGLLLAIVGSGVVLFHSVGAEYLAVVLACVTVVCLPYLLLRGGEGRRIARALILSLAGLGVLAVAYAWHIYHLGDIITGQHGTTRDTVALDVGSQSVLPARDVLAWVGSPVVWLGLLGFAALLAATRFLRKPAQVAAALTVLAWCAAMYLGSRIAVDGFPQRYERDVGGPLTILAALAVGMIVQSLIRARPSPRARKGLQTLGAAATAVVILLAMVQAGRNLATDSKASNEVLHPPLAAAGDWLHRHNTGGTIISTPDMNKGITNRAVLAMGYYTGLQSYPPDRLLHPRSLPTAGRKPLWDSHEVLTNPASCRSGNILASDDVRYVFLYRHGSEADFAAFEADSARYRVAFQNSAVTIYAPRQPTTCHATQATTGG